MGYRNLKPVNDNDDATPVNRVGGYISVGVIIIGGILTGIVLIDKLFFDAPASVPHVLPELSEWRVR